MIDKINRIFAAFAKVNAVTYLLVGGFFTASLYTFLLDARTSIEWLRPIGYLGMFIFLVNHFLPRVFYERYEMCRKYLPVFYGCHVLRDTYFYTKINSKITSGKKQVGYLYVVVRLLVNIFMGFTVFAILFLGIKKGLGL